MILHFKGWDQIDGSIVSGKQADIAYTKVMKRAKDMECAGKWYNGVFGYLFRTIPVQHSGDTRSLFCE